MNKANQPRARFKVGDWVSFAFGTREALAKIIEDRGPIGVRGRRLYRIEIPVADSEPDRFEMPEELMTTAAAPNATIKAS